MSGLIGILKAAGVVVYAGLALAGVIQWRRRRGAAGFWLALMSVILGLVVVAANTPFLLDPSRPGYVATARVLGAVLLCVPYLQYRFMATFSSRRRTEEGAVAAAAVVVVVGALVVPDFAMPGETYSPFYGLFVVTALAYWVTLTLYAALRLWAEGRAQPMGARLRMHTLGAGSLGMALAVIVSGATSPAAKSDATELALAFLALIAGLILFVGFAPPPALRAWWRRREGSRSWQLSRELMTASRPEEVAGLCATYASRLFGGRGAVLIDGSGVPLGARGLEHGETDELAILTATNSAGVDPKGGRSQRFLAVPCGDGWLAVRASAYTPFFGDQEADELRDVAALAELALGRVSLHQQVRSSHQQLTEAQSLARVGSWEWDAAANRVSWSEELYRLHGLSPRPGGLRYADVLATVHPEDRELFESTVGDALANGAPFAFEHRVVHPDGTVVRLHARGKLTSRPGEPIRVLGACQDVTEQRGLQEAVAHGALHDPLTGLANRMLFTERLSRALTRRQHGDGPMAVLLLDLDDFATVNDTRGPAAGDEVLRVVAARLKHLAGPIDTVARLGADQFGILLESTGEAETTELAERILAALAQPFAVSDEELVVHASIGIMAGVDRASAAEFLRNADAAMRAAKSAGKHGYRVFETGMHEALSRRLALRADLQHAVPAGQLWLAFQPVVSLEDGTVAAVEALARWEHPERGPVEPSEFIPIAEDSGLIVTIGEWVLDEAVSQICAWKRRFPELSGLGLHVNVSARELQQPTLVERVAAALEASGLEPELLTVEITESVLMAESDVSVAALERLRSLGVRIAIDDFGTGYSSLGYLRRLPVDTLKIDKAFIDGIMLGPEEASLARAVIKIGHALRLSVVAEGVETSAQANRLRTMGCLSAQGFHFSRPLAAEQLLDLLTAARGGAVAAG